MMSDNSAQPHSVAFLFQAKKLWGHLACVFAFGFCLIAFLYVGLPVDFTSDHVWNIRGTQALSYGELSRLVINPLTPAWFYPQAGLMEYLRPFQFLLMKTYFQYFNYSLVPFHVTAAIGLGFLSLFLFCAVAYWSRSVLLGWLAALLFASFPSHFFTMTSTYSMDFIFQYLLLSSLAVIFWGALARGRPGRIRFLVMSLAWLACVWLAIKIKSSEKLIPVVCGLFALVRFKEIVRQMPLRRILWLIGLLGFTALLIVPVRPFRDWVAPEKWDAAEQTSYAKISKDEASCKFSVDRIAQRTFPRSGEVSPLAFLKKDFIPATVTGNYGSPLGVFFWLCFAMVPLLLLKKRTAQHSDTAGMLPAGYDHYLTLFSVWLLLVLAGFGSGVAVEDLRFLSFAYIPSILVFFMVLGYFLIKTPAKWKAAVYVSTVLIMGWSIASNFVTLAKIAGHFGGFQDTIVRAEKEIARDFYAGEPDEITLYQRHQELEDRAMVIDWYDLSGTWADDMMAKLRNEKTVYFLSRSERSDRLQAIRGLGLHVALWKRFSFLDSRPYSFRASRSILQVTGLRDDVEDHCEILVYKINAPSRQSVLVAQSESV